MVLKAKIKSMYHRSRMYYALKFQSYTHATATVLPLINSGSVKIYCCRSLLTWFSLESGVLQVPLICRYP